MTLTVNGQTATPGCYVDGHWGQYGPDHFVDQLEGFGIVIGEDDNPQRYRQLAEAAEEKREEHSHWEAYHDADDALMARANEVTEGGYWEWYDGECFLRSYICPECGRDATDASTLTIYVGQPDYKGPCDYCCDADDPGCFA